MILPSLQQFARALLTPDISFRTLTQARAATDPNGVARLSRTTRFAEARIAWRGEEWLLSMPLSPLAMWHIARTVAALKRIDTPTLTPYRILRNELRWTDAAGGTHSCDLVLQLLPPGRDLKEALRTEPRDTLLAALDSLEREMEGIGFVHNNLKKENLRLCGERLVPLRYHDASMGGDPAPDRAAFEALRQEIASAPAADVLSDAAPVWEAGPRFPGHAWVSHLREGLLCVQEATGLYGYVDPDNRTAIPAAFLWADDFREGRAAVATTEGMGLIDREGRYVIPPEFDMVDYDAAESVVKVCLKGRWALYDYLGRRLTEFGESGQV